MQVPPSFIYLVTVRPWIFSPPPGGKDHSHFPSKCFWNGGTRMVNAKQFKNYNFFNNYILEMLIALLKLLEVFWNVKKNIYKVYTNTTYFVVRI